MAKTYTTPKGKAVYPRIDTPDTKFDDDGLYSCKLHVSEGDFKAFEASLKPELEAAYKAECAKQGKDKLRMASSSPVRITDDGDYEIFAKQKAKVHTKTKGTLEFSVATFDSLGKKIDTPKIGSGSELKLAAEVSPWFVPSQGFGYTLRLRAVQVIDLVEYGGGSSDGFGFGVEADGFVADGEEFTETFKAAEASEDGAPF